MSIDFCTFCRIEYVKFQIKDLKFLDMFDYFEVEAMSQSCDGSFPLNSCYLHLTLKVVRQYCSRLCSSGGNRSHSSKDFLYINYICV